MGEHKRLICALPNLRASTFSTARPFGLILLTFPNGCG